MPRLSILIPTLETRTHYLSRLLSILDPQRCPEVEILTDCDNGEVSIGAKRNRLLAASSGAYTAFIDDDDQVSARYVRSILDATSSNPDVICFGVLRTCDGRYWGRQHHSINYQRDGLIDRGDDTYEWQRIPNHLCAVRREHAIATGFRDWNNCEDSDYAERLRPLLTTEAQIAEALYQYDYRANRPGEWTNTDALRVEPPELKAYRANYWNEHKIVEG